MSADSFTRHPMPDGWLSAEISSLASAHAAVAEGIARMISALSTADQTRAGIESLRLQNAVDQYRLWADEIRAALDGAEEDLPDVRTGLVEIQKVFRTDLQSMAKALAAVAGRSVPTESLE